MSSIWVVSRIYVNNYPNCLLAEILSQSLPYFWEIIVFPLYMLEKINWLRKEILCKGEKVEKIT